MSFLERAWYKNSTWLYLLRPVSYLFTALAKRRRASQQASAKVKPAVPVIVVGNIAAGGTGKTPVVIALVNALKSNGLNPVVVSRGYGGKAPQYPLFVNGKTDVSFSGDEAKLIATKTGVPVIVDPNRPAAVDYAIKHHNADVIISDDGLQHYRMARTIEIAVVDGQRLFGNGQVFPAGPLREPIARLDEVDYILLNGEKDQLEHLPQRGAHVQRIIDAAIELAIVPSFFVNQCSGERKPYFGAPFNMGSKLQAVTGIGNPERFFALLDALPYAMKRYPFADHYQFQGSDFEGLAKDDMHPIVMTEKDAVKCEGFAGKNFWSLRIELKLPQELVDGIMSQLPKPKKPKKNQPKTAPAQPQK
ncbi:MAG: tetraacyldisaccharide 4'-kinase [Pseudohongiellaceae bacterium]|jgi:tetraacyldisaccharide 4'-kinase